MIDMLVMMDMMDMKGYDGYDRYDILQSSRQIKVNFLLNWKGWKQVLNINISKETVDVI